MSIGTTIKSFITDEILFGSEVELDPDQELIQSGFLDSVAILRLILYLEESFGIHIDDGELRTDNFSSIRRVETLVQEKLNASRGLSA